MSCRFFTQIRWHTLQRITCREIMNISACFLRPKINIVFRTNHNCYYKRNIQTDARCFIAKTFFFLLVLISITIILYCIRYSVCCLYVKCLQLLYVWPLSLYIIPDSFTCLIPRCFISWWKIFSITSEQ